MRPIIFSSTLLKSFGFSLLGVFLLTACEIIALSLFAHDKQESLTLGMHFYFFCVTYASYLLGSIPFGAFIARFGYQVDIQTMGSGNIGATNVWRVCGPAAGILTFLLDAGKAGLVLFLIKKSSFLPIFLQETPLLAASFAFMGHLFPVWLGFHGGKGIATFFGLILAWNPFVFAGMALVWGGAFLVTRQSFMGGLTCALVPVVYSFFEREEAMNPVLFLMIYGLILWRHQQNIRPYLKKNRH